MYFAKIKNNEVREIVKKSLSITSVGHPEIKNHKFGLYSNRSIRAHALLTKSSMYLIKLVKLDRNKTLSTLNGGVVENFME